MVRIGMALAVMAAGAYAFVFFAGKKGWAGRKNAQVRVMASLPLGKDVFFVLRCGPEVFALTSGPAGSRLIGRWKYEEWVRLEEEETRG
jgi:hypothetical protein